MAGKKGLIEGFDHEAFANDLAGQAQQILPKDLKDDEKHFVIDVVKRFCAMSGEALNRDANIKLDANQACLISQFIGEWTFHKSIDLIKSHVQPTLREPILQKVAATIFEIAKQAVIKKLPQQELIPLVEHHVNKVFTAEIQKLGEKGILKQDIMKQALTQSNIDDMTKEQEKRENPAAGMSDAKIIKLASLAYLLKQFDKPKAEMILRKFPPEDANVLVQYLNMQDLDKKVNPNLTKKFLQEIKGLLPELRIVSYDKCYNKLCKIVKNSAKSKILSIIKDERPQVRDFVYSAYEPHSVKIPSMVANVICQYLKEKAS